MRLKSAGVKESVYEKQQSIWGTTEGPLQSAGLQHAAHFCEGRHSLLIMLLPLVMAVSLAHFSLCVLGCQIQ